MGGTQLLELPPLPKLPGLPGTGDCRETGSAATGPTGCGRRAGAGGGALCFSPGPQGARSASYAGDASCRPGSGSGSVNWAGGPAPSPPQP
jgi:hypothetical protein